MLEDVDYQEIINDKKYDTTTADLRADWTNGRGKGDFRYEMEGLFKKRNGEFFLYGEGGPLTKYAESVAPSGMTSGAAITPLTAQQAKNWAEEHLGVEEVEELFGPVSEDGAQRLVSIKLTQDEYDQLHQAAAHQNVSDETLIKQTLQKKYFDDER